MDVTVLMYLIFISRFRVGLVSLPDFSQILYSKSLSIIFYCECSLSLNITYLRFKTTVFFYWRAPQQILRRHRSLEGLLCNPMRKMRKIMFFLLFHFNGAPVEWNWHGKTEVLGKKICPSATLSTTNPTRTGPVSNPGLRGQTPATKSLSHGTA